MKKFFLLCAICAGIIACENEPAGALSGKFTVNAAGDQVVFSKGNLQYQASTGKWQFAANQFDTIGIGNDKIAADYDGWIDLFGWGTGNNPTLASVDSTDYISFSDWGINPISNGGNKANIWRTLTKDEMDYICYTRPNASNLRGLAEVNGVFGCIFLADNSTKVIANTYTLSEWKKLEQSGAVFLPAAGGRVGQRTMTVGTWGLYWLASKSDDSHAQAVCFMAEGQEIDKYLVHYAFAVRLVKAAK